jgi:hypothetical protein
MSVVRMGVGGKTHGAQVTWKGPGSKSGDLSYARFGAFDQPMACTIAQLKVTVAHEGVDFQNMKVVLPRLYTAVNLYFCLLAHAWYSDQNAYAFSELD